MADEIKVEIVDVAARVDNIEQVGVQVQDSEGVCLQLRPGGEWVHLTHETAGELVVTLLGIGPVRQQVRKKRATFLRQIGDDGT